MTAKKRSLVAHYVNTTPSATADTYALVGNGVSTAQMAMNPQTSTVQYIHQDVATTSVDGYQPNLPIEQIVYPGDDLFDFIDAIRQAGPSIGENDITELVEVRLYETPDTAGTSYPATKWNVQIQIDNAPGGDGGAKATISYTMNVQGEQTDGDFNVSTKAFS
ncbi:MAG: hypothetical protein DSY80_06290 [Desulfocapsa sp.]|nr:MAG: hypothetical protein DSY80_06290 [Desulfocapsa sp.]